MRIVLALFGMVTFTVIANLLLKTGAAASEAGTFQVSNFLNWRLLAAMASYGVSVAFYFVLMTWLPLNVAISFAGAQYIAVVLAAWWILSEPIRPAQWTGIALIALGIAVIGWSRP